ncbi:MAG TPA: sigma-70 family RNA polymerase sigma factor [Thermoanaerobaculia bacterium]|nr:sigma-70 family RNA polymerase sigma factor [Thermoanaerobaculia bacterium]
MPTSPVSMNVADTDSRLVARARAGDARAFEELVRRHLRSAHAVALGVLGNPADAEDVCQDAFLAALEKLDECRDPERFAAWLTRIVRNQALNFRERRSLRQGEPLEAAAPAAAAADTSDPAERSELRGRLLAALESLPPSQREVVLLHDLEGWRHREIAALLGTSEGAVRVRLHEARRRLRAVLEGETEGG